MKSRSDFMWDSTYKDVCIPTSYFCLLGTYKRIDKSLEIPFLKSWGQKRRGEP